jgi:MFS transporter, DHA3 family, macrolide efflux protein
VILLKKNIFINNNFFLLWLGKIISQLGDKFYSIALAWWILQKTNSPSIMGSFLLVSVMPGLILGFYAGTMIDRWNRKRLLIITDIIRGSLVFIIVFLSLTNNLEVWHIFIIGAGISLTTSFFEPAIQAIIPQIVEEEKLPKANGMSQMVGGVCTVIGPLLGATAVSFLGLTTVFLFNAVSYFLSAVLSGFIIYKAGYKETSVDNNVWQDMKEGVNFLKSQTRIIVIITIIAIAHFFMGSIMVLLPFLAKSLSGNGVQNLGNLEMIMGLGLILGSIYISTKSGKVINEYMLIGFIMIVGVCLLGIGLEKTILISTVIPYMLLLLIIGTAIAFASVFWQSLLQSNTPSNMMGRVFSISSLAGNISLPLAYGIFGIMLSYTSIIQIMFLCGTALILLCITLLLIVFFKRIPLGA